MRGIENICLPKIYLSESTEKERLKLRFIQSTEGKDFTEDNMLYLFSILDYYLHKHFKEQI